MLLLRPPSSLFYCCFGTTEGGRSPAWLQSKVRHGARQYSNQFPVPGCAECRGWQVLSQARFLTLSKWTAGAALFWTNYQNCSALLHTYQILGEVNLLLMKEKPNLSGLQPLMDFLDLGRSIRVKIVAQTY